ncbi:hypothetical protein KI387_004882, partial [Taxus chinensis]
FLESSMNYKSGLADILRRLNSHFQDKEKETCQVNGVQRIGGLEASSRGSLLNSQISVSISRLNQSLNHSQRSPLLDAALSLMGYRITHICNATTEFLVNTLISILLSTITCKFLSKTSYSAIKVGENDANARHVQYDATWQKAIVGRTSDWRPSFDQGFLQIGSILSLNDFSQLLEACKSIFRNLEANGNLSSLLMDALLRVATSMTSFKLQYPLSSRTYKKFTEEKHSSVKLLNLFMKEEEVGDKNFNLSIRLLAWRLQPFLLKQDMENLLMEAMQRPLLQLKHELCHRDAWRLMVLNMAAAPDVFMEARCLLHKWFLLIGADRILEVRIELVAAIRDVLLKPSAWGLSKDDGLKLPTSYAFFCRRQKPLLMTLMRPLSYGNLLTIIDTLEDMQSLESFDASIYAGAGTLQSISTSVSGISLSDWKSCEKSSLVNHNSAWALLLEFPLWFHFASMILFKSENFDCSEAECRMVYQDIEQLHSNDVIQDIDRMRSSKCDSSHNAAKYLGWVLSPIDAMHRDLVIRSLLEASKGWINWRSKLLMSSRKNRIKECHNSEHNSFVLENVNKPKRKRSLFSLGNEGGGLDVRLKKVKVNAVRNDMHEMDSRDHGTEENAPAVMLWLDEFSHLCRKLWIRPVISDLVNKNAHNYGVAGNCEGWGESEALGTSGKHDHSYENTPSDGWLKQYTFLRRIPLGLFLSNVHILDEQACQMLLHFAAADGDLATITGLADGIYQETKTNPQSTAQTGHVSTSSSGQNVKTGIDTEGYAHRTENKKDSMLWCFQNEGKTNWTRVTAVILSLFDMINLSYSMFQTVNGCQNFCSEVREKAGEFLVTCIKKLLECSDFRQPRLLIDLRSRFANWAQQGEGIFTEVEHCGNANAPVEQAVWRDLMFALSIEEELFDLDINVSRLPSGNTRRWIEEWAWLTTGNFTG